MTPHIPRSPAEEVALAFAAAMGRDPSTMYELLADDFVRHGEETMWMPLGKDAYVAMSENFLGPFPDTAWEVLDVLSEGDRVVLHIVESATFSSPWVIGDVTIPPNHKTYRIHGIVIFTIREGRISEYTYVHDSTFNATYADVLTDDFGLAYYEFLIAPFAPDPSSA